MSQLTVYDLAEVVANRITRYLTATTDVSVWSEPVLHRIEGAVAAFIVNEFQYKLKEEE